MVNNYTDPDPTKSNNKKKFKNFLGSILYTKNPYPVFKIISLYQDPLTSYHLEPDSSAYLGMIRILITSEKNSSFCFVVCTGIPLLALQAMGNEELRRIYGKCLSALVFEKKFKMLNWSIFLLKIVFPPHAGNHTVPK